MQSTSGSVKGRYETLERTREPFLQRARDCASLTIPSLLPPQGHTGQSILPTPFQSDGARGVNNLASKLWLALLPPNAPFFRLRISEDALRALGAVGGSVRTQAEEGLAAIERQVQAEIETRAIRVSVFEALKQTIVTGNALCVLDPDGMRVFKLDSYVIERDPAGTILTIITKECVAPAALPPAIAAVVRAHQASNTMPSDTMEGRDRTVDIYTQVRLAKTLYHVHQEVCGMVVPGSEGTYRRDALPFWALRFNHISGEDYGRGHVEEYLGDLQSLEGLSQAIVEGSAAMARVIFLVDPNGTTRMERLSKAANGAYIAGRADDVSSLQVDKASDFSVAKGMVEQLREALAFAFLMNSAIQRNGERVTAEEIRYMAGELEDTLGGVYSLLSQELQMPLVTLMLAQMTREQKIPKLPKGVKPAIITGLEALGRGHDLTRLQVALKTASDIYGPPSLMQMTNPLEAFKRILTAAGVEPEGLLKTAEELAQDSNRAQAMAMVEKLGPEAMKQAGNMIQNQAPQPA